MKRPSAIAIATIVVLLASLAGTAIALPYGPPGCVNEHDRKFPYRKMLIAPIPDVVPGKVLPGGRLVSQTPTTPHYVDPRPSYPKYPGGAFPAGLPTWRNLLGVEPSRL